MLGSHEHSPSGSGQSCLAIGERWRVWHGPVAPGLGVRRVSVSGCDLVVLGCSAATDADLRWVASDVAAGRVDSFKGVGGSRVVVAARGDEVLVSGDLAGQRPVFHPSVSCDGLVAASHARLLAVHAGPRAGLDAEWLAAHLLLPGAADVWWTRTPWRGVNALRPGWTLHARGDGTLTQARHTMLSAPAESLESGALALRESLRQAVGSRVGDARCPTADFSGGLDSSTLAVLASDHVDGLAALTVATGGVDDAQIATEAAQQVARVRHQVIAEPAALLPYADLEHAPPTDEPWFGAATSARERWWMRQVAAEGSDLHLSGDGGDGVLLATPAYLADLSAARHGQALWRHAVGWARLRHQAPHSLIRAAVGLRGTSHAQFCRSAAERLDASTRSPQGWAELVSRFTISPAGRWATREARAAVARLLREHADTHAEAGVPGRMGIGDAAAMQALNAFARRQRLDGDVAAQWLVNHHAPYLDDGVVRACWSVPAWQRTSPIQVKPLLRRAMTGTVPAAVLDRTTKGDYTAPAYRGLRAHAGALRELISTSRLAAAGLFHRAELMAELDRGIRGHSIRLAALDAVIGTEVWLRHHEQ